MAFFEEDWRTNWEAAVQTAYSDAFIDELLRRHGVEPVIPIADVAEFLRFSGANYLQQKSTEDTPAARKRRQKPIREILNSAERLASQIRALAPSAEMAFWRPLRYGDFGLFAAVDTAAASENNITQTQRDRATSETTAFDNRAATFPEFKGLPKTPLGQTVRTIRMEEGEAVLCMGEPEILEALVITQNLARFALAHIAQQKGRGGAPRAITLRNWVANMQTLWAQHFGERFTYSEENGGSRALLFCLDVMTPLDPKVKPAAIGTAMRTVIARFNKVKRAAASGTRENVHR